jgi:hypothetical protein
MDEQPTIASEDDADLIRLMRSLRAHDSAREPVPDDLWARIEAEVAPRAADTEVVSAVSPQGATVVDLAARRRRRWLGVVAAVSVAAASAAAVALVTRDGDSSRELATVALSNDGLATFPVAPSGTARLVDERGTLVLEVNLADRPEVGGRYVEVWLIDRNVVGMVSLGPERADGRYVVPAGVDPGAFPVVDVSLEPADGLPTHSGVSIVRGVLEV